MSRPLTAKQLLFVQEYLVDLNATQAAIRAGYSKRTARATGSENLTKPDVAAAIAQAQVSRVAKIEISAEDVLRRLWAEGNLTGEGASHSARVQALKLVGLHTGLKFTERHELGGPGGGPIALEARPDLSKLGREELLEFLSMLSRVQAAPALVEGESETADA